MLKSFNLVVIQFDEFEKFILSVEDGVETVDTGARALSEAHLGHSWKKTGEPGPTQWWA